MEIITIIFIVTANCGELDPACEYTITEGTKSSIQIGSLEQSPLPIKSKRNILDEAKGDY